MIQRPLYFLLVCGITFCGFNVPVEAKPPFSNKTPIITEDSNVQALDIETVKLGYDALMQAGYAADKERDYITALRYFRQALSLRPNDSWANKAINNITTYAFDRYMQAGYKADVNRDYRLALKYFQTALEIKPNSFYAQKAVANVSNYLAANAQDSNNSKDSQNFNWLWMLIGIAGTVGISAIVLFFLFKKNQNINLAPTAEASLPENLANSSVKETSNPIANNPPPPETKLDFTEEETLITPSKPDNSAPKTEANQNQQIIPANTKISKLDIVPELITELEKSDRLSRQKTIWELAQRGDSRAMQPLVELMVTVDSQERGLILEAMTQITSRTLKPMNKAIMMSLEDDNPRVKQNAIRDLARVYELMNQVTKRLSSVAEDSDEEVQKTAEWALKQLNQMPTVPLWQNAKMTENGQDISN